MRCVGRDARGAKCDVDKVCGVRSVVDERAWPRGVKSELLAAKGTMSRLTRFPARSLHLLVPA